MPTKMDDYIKRRMKENADIFRNALERIVQKYSNVDGSGTEVCLRSMTCQTEEGIRPWDGMEAERQMKSLKEEASRKYDDSSSIAMGTEMERSSESLFWDSGADGSQLLSSTASDSCCDQQELLLQPEEQDEELERTLSSQGSMLLQLYPSMLSQVGEACRRQQVTQAASAVLRRYRKRGWRSRMQKPCLQHSVLRKPPRGRGWESGEECDTPTPTSSAPSSAEEHSLLSRTYTVSMPHVPSRAEGGAPIQSLNSRGGRGKSPPVQQGCVPWGPKSPQSPGARQRQSQRVPCTGLQWPSAYGPCGEQSRPPQSPAEICPPSCSGMSPKMGASVLHPVPQEAPHAWWESPAAEQMPQTIPPRLDPPTPFPDISSGGSSAGLWQRRHSLSGCKVSTPPARKLIDLEFERLYQRLVSDCTAPAPPCSAPLSPAPGWGSPKRSMAGIPFSSPSSSLAALALSPLWSRVQKRYRDVDQETSPRSKRSREKYILSPGRSRHADTGLGCSHHSDSCLTYMLPDSPRSKPCWSTYKPRKRLPLLRGSSPGPSRNLGRLLRKAPGSEDGLQELRFCYASRHDDDALSAAYEDDSFCTVSRSDQTGQPGLDQQRNQHSASVMTS
ncbi:hypothetical protein MATL_G00039000 [Megalops atlanticus]|uniref:Uncharacterized protein n=1 Tax=Megalops atlanticus TaxID=7932 RepID=A0A9D3QE88_MEGAT|nr:hypothetical protein MATL_G00039000 [Megalops atlanticus]